MNDGNCEKYEDLIILSVDGELDEAGARTLDEHLAACEKCRALYDGYERMDSAVRATIVPGEDEIPLFSPDKKTMGFLDLVIGFFSGTRAVPAMVASAAFVGMLATALYIYIQGDPAGEMRSSGFLAGYSESALSKFEKNAVLEEGTAVVTADDSSEFVTRYYSMRPERDAHFTVGKRKVAISAGSANFEFFRSGDEYSVETPDFTIFITGTKFSVSCAPSSSCVSVRKGSVRVRTSSDEKDVAAGNLALVRRGQTRIEVRTDSTAPKNVETKAAEAKNPETKASGVKIIGPTEAKEPGRKTKDTAGAAASSSETNISHNALPAANGSEISRDAAGGGAAVTSETALKNANGIGYEVDIDSLDAKTRKLIFNKK